MNTIVGRRLVHHHPLLSYCNRTFIGLVNHNLLHCRQVNTLFALKYHTRTTNTTIAQHRVNSKKHHHQKKSSNSNNNNNYSNVMDNRNTLTQLNNRPRKDMYNIDTEYALLHLTLMYSRSSVVCHYADKLEHEMKQLESDLNNNSTTGKCDNNSIFNQLFRYYCILTGIYLLNANLDKAQYHGSRLEHWKSKIMENQNDNDSHDKQCLTLSEENELFARSLQCWLSGDLEQSVLVHQDLLQKYPRNLFCLFFVYQHAIILYHMSWLHSMFESHILPAFSLSTKNGQDNQVFCATTVIDKLLKKSKSEDEVGDNLHDDWFNLQFVHYVQGMYCFVLEEMNRMEEAEKFGLDSLKNYSHFTKFIDQYADRVRGGCYGKDTNDQSSQLVFIQPWTHHSLCHVYHTNGRFTEGIQFMRQHCLDWHRCDAFLQTHNYWHLALLYLDRNHRGDVEECLSLYKNHVWIEKSCQSSTEEKNSRERAQERDENESDENWKDDAGVQCGAINLLWKMDFCKISSEDNDNTTTSALAASSSASDEPMNIESKLKLDHSTDELWRELSSYCESLMKHHLSGYIDFHFAYLLARNFVNRNMSGCVGSNKDDILEFEQELESQTIVSDDDKDNMYVRSKRMIMKRLAIPITRGIIYYMSQQHEKAYQEMKHLFEQQVDTVPNALGNPNYKHNGLGGSLAQREVLGDLWVQVLIQSGRFREALEELKLRHDYCIGHHHSSEQRQSTSTRVMSSISRNQFILASRLAQMSEEQRKEKLQSLEPLALDDAKLFHFDTIMNSRRRALPKHLRSKSATSIRSQISGESEGSIVFSTE